MPDLVLTVTSRTMPFLSEWTLRTLPRGQVLQGELLALTRTTSPAVRFLRFLNHFCLIWSWGKYSLDHRLQQMFERYWTWFHLRQAKQSSSLKRPGGNWVSHCKRSRWFGVKASKSRWSVETVVSGRPFIVLSTSHSRVDKLPSIVCIWNKAWSIFRTVRMQHSHAPPKCEPLGRLKIHLMFFCSSVLWILLWFHVLIDSLSSLSPLVKLVALSDLITLT